MIKLCLIEKMFLRNSALLIRRISSNKLFTVCNRKGGLGKKEAVGLCCRPFIFFLLIPPHPSRLYVALVVETCCSFWGAVAPQKSTPLILWTTDLSSSSASNVQLYKRGTKRTRGSEKYYIEITKSIIGLHCTFS